MTRKIDEGLIKIALIGFHNPENLRRYEKFVEDAGYGVTKAANMVQMLEIARCREYDLYLMDANLGLEGSPNPNSCHTIFSLVRGRFYQGEAHFLAVSENSDAVRNARSRGVPAIKKEDKSFYKWLEEKIYR